MRNCDNSVAAKPDVSSAPVSDSEDWSDCAYGTMTGDKNCCPMTSTKTHTRQATNANCSSERVERGILSGCVGHPLSFILVVEPNLHII